MNLLKRTVTRIMTNPYQKYIESKYEQLRNKWVVLYEYNCYGRLSQSEELFNSKEEADKFKVGDMRMG